MYQDIVANTDPVMGVLTQAAQQLLEQNNYIHPSSAFYSAKRNLMSYRMVNEITPLSRNCSNSSFHSDIDEDKIENEAFENLSEFIDDQDQDLVRDFIHFKPDQLDQRRQARSEIDELDFADLRIIEARRLLAGSDERETEQEIVIENWENQNRS